MIEIHFTFSDSKNTAGGPPVTRSFYLKIPSEDFCPSLPPEDYTEDSKVRRTALRIQHDTVNIPAFFWRVAMVHNRVYCYIDISWSAHSSLQLIMYLSCSRRFPVSGFKESVKVDVGVRELKVN
jgi:hypothetical protein